MWMGFGFIVMSLSDWVVVSIRWCYLQKPFAPKKYFSIDRVFRNEAVDRTHLAEFHQIEGVDVILVFITLCVCIFTMRCQQSVLYKLLDPSSGPRELKFFLSTWVGVWSSLISPVDCSFVLVQTRHSQLLCWLKIGSRKYVKISQAFL